MKIVALDKVLNIFYRVLQFIALIPKSDEPVASIQNFITLSALDISIEMSVYDSKINFWDKTFLQN